MENTTFNQVFELEAQAAALKQKQRQIALEYTKKIIKSFGFSTKELLDSNRNGSVDICRKIIAANPDIRRREFLEKAIAAGVNKATASTQFSRIKKH